MADYKILTIPFARDAVPDMVNDIPETPSPSEPQLASYRQGFPSITTIPLVAGGIPPEGQDFNGILRDITQHIVHQNKGGMYKFEADIVAAGGYPEGAVLAANDGLSLWVSLVDANVEDFNAGTPTQWARIAFSGLDALLNGKVDKTSIVQVTGASTTNIMSQKAVTDALVGVFPDSIRTSGIAGSFSNLKASATGLSSLVEITADSICLKNSSNEQIVLNAVSVTPSLAASGANGLDTGTSVASTWYGVWVIWNGTTISGLLSLSATSPTLPGGYTHKARVGWIRTDATANKYPLGFTQKGRKVQYKVGGNVAEMPKLVSGIQGNPSTPTWVAVSLANYFPPTASEIFVSLYNQGAATQTILAPSNAYGAVNAATNMPMVNISNSSANSNQNNFLARIIPESANIYYASNASVSHASALGWEDNL